MSITDIDASLPYSTAQIDYLGAIDRSIFIENLLKNGINAICGGLLPPSGFFEQHNITEAVGTLNRAALEAVSENSIEYRPAICVHPDCAEFCCQQIEQYSQQGIHMISRVSAAWLEKEDNMHQILACAENCSMMICLRGESPAVVEYLASRYPALRILAGGYDSKGFLPSLMADLMNRFRNLYLNLSGSVWRNNYVLKSWCDRMPAERILFGSGYPFTNPAAAVAGIRWELRDQSQAIQEMIFNRNARQILGGE